MRNETPDRQQMHEELQELAKLATPGPGVAREQAHGFESADSSGYVDLSAYRADDESWIERELARAKAGVELTGQRAIDGLAPQSMAPVALEALLAADDKGEDEAPPRRRWPLALAAVASVAAVAALALVVTRNAPHAAKATQAAAPPPQPAPAAETTPTTTPTQAAPETAERVPSASAPSTSTPEPSPEPAAKKPHAVHASRHVPAQSSAAIAARPAAARPVAIPASHPVKSSGDSLMDAIRASVKK